MGAILVAEAWRAVQPEWAIEILEVPPARAASEVGRAAALVPVALEECRAWAADPGAVLAEEEVCAAVAGGGRHERDNDHEVNNS